MDGVTDGGAGEDEAVVGGVVVGEGVDVGGAGEGEGEDGADISSWVDGDGAGGLAVEVAKEGAEAREEVVIFVFGVACCPRGEELDESQMGMRGEDGEPGALGAEGDVASGVQECANEGLEGDGIAESEGFEDKEGVVGGRDRPYSAEGACGDAGEAEEGEGDATGEGGTDFA